MISGVSIYRHLNIIERPSKGESISLRTKGWAAYSISYFNAGLNLYNVCIIHVVCICKFMYMYIYILQAYMYMYYMY